MGFKYAIRSDRLHFLTHTVVDWIDLFTRQELATIVVDSMNYCIKNKGLEVYVWCLMPSHLHMIAAGRERNEKDLSNIMRDFKSHTSRALLSGIHVIDESRREWLEARFERGKNTNQVWQAGMHPVELYSNRFMDQKMNYIHNNPIAAGIVEEPQHYLLSFTLRTAKG